MKTAIINRKRIPVCGGKLKALGEKTGAFTMLGITMYEYRCKKCGYSFKSNETDAEKHRFCTYPKLKEETQAVANLNKE